MTIPEAVEIAGFSSAKGACKLAIENEFVPDDLTELRCTNTELGVGDEWSIVVNAQAGDLGASATFRAEVSNKEAETNSSNNYSSATVQISGDPAADLVVRPGVLDENPDDLSEFFITLFIDNDGPSIAHNVQLTAERGVFAAALLELSELYEGDDSERVDCDPGSCTLDLGTIAVNATREVYLECYSETGNTSVLFTAVANEPDPDGTNNHKIPYFEPATPGAGSQQAKQQILEQPRPLQSPTALLGTISSLFPRAAVTPFGERDFRRMYKSPAAPSG